MTPSNSRGPSAEAHQRALLARTLEGRCDDIVARWLAQVQADLALDDSGGPVETTQLRDAMPDPLRRLGRALRNGAPSLSEGGNAAWAQVAREHAITRVRLGFDVDHLIHELNPLSTVKLAAARARQSTGEAQQRALFERFERP